MKKSLFIIAGVVALACNNDTEKRSDLFAKGTPLGQVEKRLEEASGLVESVAHPNHFWTMNDSGHPAEVFLIDNKAQIQLTCKLKGIDNRDFEDITIGDGPVEGKKYIYVADIGDNLEKYDVKLIYRFVEPSSITNQEMTITEFDTLKVKLEDRVRDTEAIFIDPLLNDMYLVSKREDSVRLYQIAQPFVNDTLIAKPIAILPFHKIVAASITADGQELLLKDYDHVYYWKNKERLSISKLLQTKPAILAYERERQGEAICWANDGKGYYTLSEAVNDEMGKLLFYSRNAANKK
ncbi:MAG: hypothetical protein ACKO96_27190 [Flammeovirgaceae bacterium]